MAPLNVYLVEYKPLFRNDPKHIMLYVETEPLTEGKIFHVRSKHGFDFFFEQKNETPRTSDRLDSIKEKADLQRFAPTQKSRNAS